MRRLIPLVAIAGLAALGASSATQIPAFGQVAATSVDEPSGTSPDGTDFSVSGQSGVVDSKSGDMTITGEVTNWSGEDAPANDPKAHTTIVGGQISRQQTATSSMVAADQGTYVSATGRSLAQAAAAGTIHYKTWSQWNCSHLGCGAWKKTQSGRVYYDGTTTWTRARAGFTGFHTCSGWSAFGYSVSFTGCRNLGSDPATYSTGPNHQHLQDDYVITLLFHGFPVHNSLWQYANIYASGNIYFHWEVK